MNDRYEEEKEAFLAHYGVPGMRWGKRKLYSPDGSRELSRKEARDVRKDAKATARAAKPDVGTQKSRNDAYGKDPTTKEFLLGAGKTRQERTASRVNYGKKAAGLVVAGAAAKVLVNALPANPTVKFGVSLVANSLQVGAIAGATYTGIAEVVDRSTS